MPDTHDIGRSYWYLQRYPDYADWSLPVRMPRLTESAITSEIEEPFRTGRGRAFRFWPTRWFLVLGRWSKDGQHETKALQQAAQGRMLDTRLAEIREWPGAAPDENLLEDTPGVIAWVEPETTS